MKTLKVKVGSNDDQQKPLCPHYGTELTHVTDRRLNSPRCGAYGWRIVCRHAILEN